MGCDIHIWVEVRDKGGKWHMVPYPESLCHDKYGDVPDHLRGRVDSGKLAEYAHGISPLPIPLPFNLDDFLGSTGKTRDLGKGRKDEDNTPDGVFNHRKWWESSHPMSYLGERNYNLFSILADVRNGYGFAGLKTGEGFVPISNPRGVPDDASLEYKEHVERWRADGHSHSYHTLKHLLDYDWEQMTGLQGVVGMLEYARWVKSKRGERGEGPLSYSGGVSGPAIQMVSEQEMMAFVMEKGILELVDPNEDSGFGLADEQRLRDMALETPDGKHWYTVVKWGEKYKTAASGFYTEVIPWLQSLVEDPDTIRIVFFFDN